MKYATIARTIRRHPAFWGEQGEAKMQQATRIFKKANKKAIEGWKRAENMDTIDHKGERYARMGY